MDQKPTDESVGASAAEPPARKLPYEKPAFRFEGVFETTALACGKIAGTQGQCNRLPRTS